MSDNVKTYALEPWREELLERAFAGLPQDYESLSPALAALRQSFHSHLAKTLEPAIHKHFQSVQVHTFTDRKRLADWVDRVTRKLRVTTADLETGRPGLIVAERPVLPEKGDPSHFKMVIVTGRHRRGISGRLIQQDLSDVPLIPAPDDIYERFERVRPDPSRGKNR
jgi:hypothetical protein